jgi:hypothetical protein
MKKQTNARKLVLKRELLADLQDVTGGDEVKLNDTVYRPAPSYNCATAGCGYA